MELSGESCPIEKFHLGQEWADSSTLECSDTGWKNAESVCSQNKGCNGQMAYRWGCQWTGLPTVSSFEGDLG